MASVFRDWIESAETLKVAQESFEADLRAALKNELMALAESRIDAIVDETAKKLETKLGAAIDGYSMTRLVKVLVQRIGE